MTDIIGKMGQSLSNVLPDFFTRNTPIPILDKLIKYFDKLQFDDGEIEERQSNIDVLQSEINGYNKQKQAIESVQDEYNGLVKKQKLSTTEAERLTELTEYLASASPDMVLGYKDDGTPILKNLQMQSKQLENQMKLKQQSLRLEENLLSTQIQQRRAQEKTDYNKTLEKYSDMDLATSTDRKDGWGGIGDESLQEYAKRVVANNEKITKENAETYEQRLQDHQQYVEEEKNIQRKYLNQMSQNSNFKEMSI